MSGANLVFWVIVALCAIQSAAFLALARFDPIRCGNCRGWQGRLDLINPMLVRRASVRAIVDRPRRAGSPWVEP